MVRILNIVAAVLIALLPALEPCRLHGVFQPAHEPQEAAVHRCCGHAHNDEPAEPDGPQRCPECPEACTHLDGAMALPAQAQLSPVMAVPPSLPTPALITPSVSARLARAMFQHPPPTGVALVGISNIRI